MVVIRHYAPNAEGLVHLQKAGSFQHSHRHGEGQSEPDGIPKAQRSSPNVLFFFLHSVDILSSNGVIFFIKFSFFLY